LEFRFRYTGLRVRDLDGAINFFTQVLGMKLESRVKAPRNKGEFANLTSKAEKQWLELNWYADDSPIAGPFQEGDALDHLGFQVDNFNKALDRLKEAGYPVVLGPSPRRRLERRLCEGIRWTLARYLQNAKKEA